MRQGEIWWVRIPFTGGHEQAGERPALIVQSDAAIAALPTVLVVPFTSVLANLAISRDAANSADTAKRASRPVGGFGLPDAGLGQTLLPSPHGRTGCGDPFANLGVAGQLAGSVREGESARSMAI